MALPAPFPNESADYRAARNTLLNAEIALRAQLEDVARLRRALPQGGAVPMDYAFQEIAGGARQTVRLSELFRPGAGSLLLYSYMFGPGAPAPCPMCTSLLDGLDGEVPHIARRAPLVAVISGPPEQADAIRKARGWKNLRVLSAEGTDYSRIYHGETAEGAQQPMMNVFTRESGTEPVRHFWGSEMLYADLEGHMRHMDLLWPLWSALDLTPEGRGEDWFPALDYSSGT